MYLSIDVHTYVRLYVPMYFIVLSIISFFWYGTVRYGTVKHFFQFCFLSKNDDVKIDTVVKNGALTYTLKTSIDDIKKIPL